MIACIIAWVGDNLPEYSKLTNGYTTQERWLTIPQQWLCLTSPLCIPTYKDPCPLCVPHLWIEAKECMYVWGLSPYHSCYIKARLLSDPFPILSIHFSKLRLQCSGWLECKHLPLFIAFSSSKDPGFTDPLFLLLIIHFISAITFDWDLLTIFSLLL